MTYFEIAPFRGTHFLVIKHKPKIVCHFCGKALQLGEEWIEFCWLVESDYGQSDFDFDLSYSAHKSCVLEEMTDKCEDFRDE